MHISGYVAMMIGMILTLALDGGLILLLMRQNRNSALAQTDSQAVARADHLELRRHVRVHKKCGTLCFDLLAGSFPVLVRTPLLPSILLPEVVGQSADRFSSSSKVSNMADHLSPSAAVLPI